MPDGTVALRICQEGHANALALNKDSTQIAVAGRSCMLFVSFSHDDSQTLSYALRITLIQLIGFSFYSIESFIN